MALKAGLVNIGNTCYINTALQCLYNCDVFITFISTGDGSNLHQALRSLSKEMQSNTTAVKPMAFLQSIAKYMSNAIDICEQNDIMEFISLFFETFLRVEGIDVRQKMFTVINNISYNDTSYDRQKYKMDRDWAEKVGKEYSKLCPLVIGQSISQIVCNNCHKIWHNYDVYQDISIAIEGNTLDECLVKHFEGVVLSEWKCEQCAKGSMSNRITKLWRNPSILIIALKRFDYMPQCNAIMKNSKKILINENINIERFSVGKSKNNYALKSVAIHSGSYHGGHYRAVCRHKDCNWYMYDDDTIMKLGTSLPDDVSQGYVFFYESTSL